MKIVIAGEYYSSNLGDPAIVDSVEYLIRMLVPAAEISILDLDGREKVPQNNFPKLKGNGSFSQLKVLLKWLTKDNSRLTQYYRKKLRGADLLIFAGGQMIMNNNLNFPLRIDAIVQLAMKLGIPVAFNACGVQKYERHNLGTAIIRKYLNAANVKIISTRNDLDFIKHFYLHKNANIQLLETSDPAIWCSESYNVKRASTSSTIGLGVISPNAYQKYLDRTGDSSYYVSENDLVSFWNKLFTELTEHNLQFELFTNGAIEDYDFALKLKAENPSIIIAKRPYTAKELTNNISCYKTVLGSRLHSLIISTSLGIPTFGVVWDDKINAFSKKEQLLENILDVKTFSDFQEFIRILSTVNYSKLPQLEKTKQLALLSIKKGLSPLSY